MSKLFKLKNSEYKIVSYLLQNENIRLSFSDLQGILNINERSIRKVISDLEASLIVTVNRTSNVNSYSINDEADWQIFDTKRRY